MITKKKETFVPENMYEILPESIPPSAWKEVNNKFGTLIQAVNGTAFNSSFELDNTLGVFLEMLNNLGKGKYVILSVGENTQFTFKDVIVQDIETLSVTKFTRVDLVVDSMNPFKFKKVIITPDKYFNSTQNVQGKTDELSNEFFEIKNPLHLFYPYETTDNDMAITPYDMEIFKKEEMLRKMNEENQKKNSQ